MTTLREAAQQALEVIEQDNPLGRQGTIAKLRTALAEQSAEREPLTAEQIEQAYREIWRNVPSDFTHTTHDWIEQGIKYAERAHGINVPQARGEQE